MDIHFITVLEFKLNVSTFEIIADVVKIKCSNSTKPVQLLDLLEQSRRNTARGGGGSNGRGRLSLADNSLPNNYAIVSKSWKLLEYSSINEMINQ